MSSTKKSKRNARPPKRYVQDDGTENSVKLQRVAISNIPVVPAVSAIAPITGGGQDNNVAATIAAGTSMVVAETSTTTTATTFVQDSVLMLSTNVAAGGGQDNIVAAVMGGQDSVSSTVAVAVPGGTADSEVAHSQVSKLPFGVSLDKYELFINLPNSHWLIKKVDVDNGNWVLCKICDVQVKLRQDRPFQLGGMGSRWDEHTKQRQHCLKLELHNDRQQMIAKRKLGDSSLTEKEVQKLKIMSKVQNSVKSYFQVKPKVSRFSQLYVLFYL